MMAPDALLSMLQSIGVGLAVVDGRLSVEAPKGAISVELLSEMKAHRDELIKLLSEPVDLAEQFSSSGVICPYCRHDQFDAEPSGWRCLNCGKLAWGWLGGSFVRADFIFVEL